MINTSEEYKKAVLEKRKFLAKATCLLKDGTLLEFDKSRLMIGGVTISDATSSSGSFDIGAAIVNQLTMKLNNMDEVLSAYDFTDAQITVWAGLQLENRVEWLKKGVFNASDPTETPAVLTLKALDNMSKFDKAYDGDIVFPSSIQGIVQHCCAKCGVLLASEKIPNGDYIINNQVQGDNLTYRVLISYCAVVAGCYARCNPDGALELKWYDRTAFSENGTHVDIKKFSSLSVSNVDVVITGIRVTASDGKDEKLKGETYLAGTEGYVLSISGNPFIEYGNAKTIASMLAERIVGMRFRPMNASCVGDPSVEAGDAAVLTDRKGRTYNCYLTNLTYSVGDYTSISCDAEPAARHSADRFKEIDKIISDIKEETRQELSQYGKYLDQMNGLAINAMGYYETVEIQDDGSRITYMHDKPLMSESMVIYKKSIDGYFWSKDGGKTWTSGIDKNGNAVMNVIAAIGLHAEWITSGKLQVSDDEGNIIFLVDMDTKQVLISGDHIRIGGETATDLITIANENASEALNAAAKARNVTMQLSNDFQAIAVDSNGNYSQFPEHVETSPMVMYGTQDITKECSFLVTKSEYVQGTWDNAKKVYTVTGLTADEGWVDIKATYLTISASKRFVLSKQYAGKPGQQGEPGRTYFLEPSTLILKKGQDNVISPGTVDFKAFYRDGNSASRTAYAGRFKIEETVDGTTWKTIYTSSANESSVKHSTYDYLTDAAGNVIITASGHGIVATVRDIHMIRCTLYAAGGTTNALDTQSVTVVKDVKALTQEEVFNLLTNNGAVKGVYMEDGQLYFSFTYARGGILALGGLNNGNGLLEVYDENGSIIGQWGKNGLETKGKYFTIDEKGNVYSNFPVFQHLYMAYTVNDDPLKYTGMEKYKAEVMRLVLSASPAGSGYGIWLGNENALNTKPIVSVTSRVNFICYKDLKVHGTKSRIVKTREYSTRALYCYEMPTPMFGDIGEAVTDESGVCYIYLDDIFTETINTGIEYQIFLQKEGKGDLWVDSKGPAYFVVKGTPGLKFSWEMKAKQRDYEYERLEDAEITENFTNIINYEEQGQKLFEEYLLEKETAYEESN